MMEFQSIPLELSWEEDKEEFVASRSMKCIG